MLRIIFPPSLLTLFPYTTLFRSLRHFERKLAVSGKDASRRANLVADRDGQRLTPLQRNRAPAFESAGPNLGDRKSTRLNSSHSQSSYADYCLLKKKSTRLNSSHS